MKPEIILHSSSKSFGSSSLDSDVISPRFSKTIAILAFSNAERFAILRKLANSFLDDEPDPFYPVKYDLSLMCKNLFPLYVLKYFSFFIAFSCFKHAS